MGLYFLRQKNHSQHCVCMRVHTCAYLPSTHGDHKSGFGYVKFGLCLFRHPGGAVKVTVQSSVRIAREGRYYIRAAKSHRKQFMTKEVLDSQGNLSIVS